MAILKFLVGDGINVPTANAIKETSRERNKKKRVGASYVLHKCSAEL